jgi:hypothetical protein
MLVEKPEISGIFYGAYMLKMFTSTTIQGSAFKPPPSLWSRTLSVISKHLEWCTFLARCHVLKHCFAMTSELSRYRASPRAVVESKFGAILRFLMRRCRDSKLWFGEGPNSPRQATGDIQSGRALYLVLWLGSTESRCGSLFCQSTAHCPTSKVDTIGRLEMVESKAASPSTKASCVYSMISLSLWTSAVENRFPALHSVYHNTTHHNVVRPT